MRRFVALFAVFWLALTVQAQAHTTPISHKLHKRLTKTLPSCVLACIETAAQIADCPSDDTACLCESEGFLGGFASCLNRHCDEQADKDAGVDIGETYCGWLGVQANLGQFMVDTTPDETEKAATAGAATSSVATPLLALSVMLTTTLLLS